MDKKFNLVVVITAGNYNLRGLRNSSFEVYPDFVYRAVVKKSELGLMEEELKALTYKAIRAGFNFDTTTVASLMDENFISVYPHKTQSKQQELQGMYQSITKMKEEG
jgi:hypothetical protein